MSRFDYVKYDQQAAAQQDLFKTLVSNLEMCIDAIGSANPKEVARAKALAITNLEQTYMWIGKALRDDQIARNGSAPLQEERTNG